MITATSKRGGFTLLETVIAIGVLAVLLTAFLAVFGPATAGIRRAISVQEADRLASTLERELTTLRPGQSSSDIVTGFDKAYSWIEDSMKKTSPQVLFIYQYRGNSNNLRSDGTLEPYTTTGGVAGKDYTVVPMVRRRDDSAFEQDLAALEGRVFAVKTGQLVFTGGQLILSSGEKIADPSPGGDPPGTVQLSGPGAAGKYPEAVIAFSAGFYSVPSTAPAYLKAGGAFNSDKLKNPIFTRNLAVRR
jgi:prepilin-type N-terminal cleavage/methylation domain-containing protein